MTDSGYVELQTRPLFRFDPGWLFIAAGMAVCAAGVILPAQADLQALQLQLGQLQAEEVQAYARLKAHADFMDQVDRADPALVRRLAATQLNLVPESDTPVLLAVSETSPVTHWIDATVQVDIRPPKPVPVSTLSRLANGPHRLWMIGSGIMCVFAGVLVHPAPLRLRLPRLRRSIGLTEVKFEPSTNADADVDADADADVDAGLSSQQVLDAGDEVVAQAHVDGGAFAAGLLDEPSCGIDATDLGAVIGEAQLIGEAANGLEELVDDDTIVDSTGQGELVITDAGQGDEKKDDDDEGEIRLPI